MTKERTAILVAWLCFMAAGALVGVCGFIAHASGGRAVGGKTEAAQPEQQTTIYTVKSVHGDYYGVLIGYEMQPTTTAIDRSGRP